MPKARSSRRRDRVQARKPRFEVLETRRLLAADFGDAPAPYPTLLNGGGASHEINGILQLGPTIDAENNGRVSPPASGDPSDDGVTFGTIRIGQLAASVVVNVQGSAGYLDAWIDFNRDGSWSGQGEQIALSQRVEVGDNTLYFDVPANANPGTTYARFRLSTAGGLTPRGAAPDGEVEDYQITIESPVPTSANFERRHHIANSVGSLPQIVHGDLNNDGRLDLVVYATTGQTLRWYEQSTSGAFFERTIVSGQFAVQAIHLSDIDSDGDLDIVVATDSTNSIVAFINDGSPQSGAWQQQTISSTIGLVRDIDTADIDNDGDMDIVVAAFDQGRVYWLDNDGSGAYLPRTISANSTSANAVLVVDIDRDGDLDVVLSSTNSNEVTYQENDGTPAVGTWPQRVISSTTGTASNLFATDIDDDGDIDLFTVTTTGSVHWHENDGTPISGWTSYFVNDVGHNGQFGDYNGDGHIDVFGRIKGVVPSVEHLIVFNDGAQSFGGRQFLFTEEFSAAHTADVDQDGDLDIIATIAATNELVWYENTTHVEVSIAESYVHEVDEPTVTVSVSSEFAVQETTTVDLVISGIGITSQDFAIEDDRPDIPGIQVEILAGESVGSIELTILDDSMVDPSEELIVRLANPGVGMTLGRRMTAGVYIVDDELSDFGDAPQSYGTLQSMRGAGHIPAFLRLGNTITSEADGLPGDGANLDADDGVVFGEIRVGDIDVTITVDVQGSFGRIDAWIDFNGDGVWSGPQEQILNSVPVAVGLNTFTFGVPASARPGVSFARIRLSISGGLSPIGPATTGEVEDYAVEILPAIWSGNAYTHQQFTQYNNGIAQVLPYDFDLDGDVDILAVRESGGLLFYANNGLDDVSQWEQQSIPGGGGARFMRLAHVNDDELIDVVGTSGSTLYVGINQGDLTFSQVFVSNTHSLNNIVVDDLDQDGDIDIVATSVESALILWFEQVAPNTFVERIISSPHNEVRQPRGLAVGDEDGDGDLDIYVTTGSQTLLFRNDGHEVFDPVVIVEQRLFDRDIPIADIDGDGDLDVLALGSEEGTLAWFERTNDGEYIEHAIPISNAKIYSIRVVDVNGDGLPDIVTAAGNAYVLLLTNQGDGEFIASIVSDSLVDGEQVELADFDGDGDLDILALGGQLTIHSIDRIYIFEQVIDLTLDPLPATIYEGSTDTIELTVIASTPVSETTIVDLLLYGRGLTAGDYTIDDDDPTREGVQIAILAGETSGSVTLSIIDDSVVEGGERWQFELANASRGAAIGERYGTFTLVIDNDAGDYGDAPSSYPVGQERLGAVHAPVGPRLGNTRGLELDGTPSAFADAHATDDGVQIVGFTVGAAAQLIVDVQEAAGFIDAWFDFNGDGSWHGPGEQAIVSHLVPAGTTTLAFAVPGWATVGNIAARIRLSSSGGLDVIGAAADGEVEDYVFALQGSVQTSGLFRDPQSVSSTSSVSSNDAARAMDVVDFDGDGDADVITTFLNGMEWHENLGNGEFLNHTIATTGGANWIRAVDLDQDGDMDVITASGQAIWYYENDGAGDFTRRSLLGMSTYDDWIEAADIDGDGDLDIVAASNSGSLAWWSNNGAQQFTRVPIDAGARGGPGSVVDLDGDGDLDILSTSVVDGHLNWFQNDGAGNFSRQSIPTSSNFSTSSVSAIDLDGDGDLDIVVTSLSVGIVWYVNSGGTFTETPLVGDQSMLNERVHSVAFGDLDGDRDIDIVARVGVGGALAVLVNDGTATFTSRMLSDGIPSSSSSYLELADIDLDGDLDIVGSALQQRIGWYENVIEIGLSATHAVVNEGDATSIQLTAESEFPVNSDARVDVVISGNGINADDYIVEDADPVAPGIQIVIPAGATTGSITLQMLDDDNFEGQETLTVTLSAPYGVVAIGENASWVIDVVDDELGDFGDAPLPYPVTTARGGAGHGSHGPQLGDSRGIATNGIHSDGLGDSSDDGTEFVDLYVGSATASATVDVQGGSGYINIWLDLNQDGSWDGPHEHVVRGQSVPEGISTIQFEIPATATPGATFARVRLSTTRSLAVGGVAPDGEVEDYPVSIVLPDVVSNVFAPPIVVESPTARVTAFQVIDFDRDGDMDLVMAHTDNTVRWYDNQGNNQFAESILYTFAGVTVESLVVIDIDDDGDFDIVSAAGSAQRVFFFENNASGVFSLLTQVQTGGVPRQIEAIDFDRDGDLDFFVAGASANTLSWIENLGNNSYRHNVLAFQAGVVSSMQMGDIDGDGDLDVVVGFLSNEQLSWFENQGGVFVEHQIPTTVASVSDLTLGDFDGDGLQDIAIVWEAGNRVVWFRQLVDGGFEERLVSNELRGPVSIEAADISGDGRLDLIVASTNDDTVAWFEASDILEFSMRIVTEDPDGNGSAQGIVNGVAFAVPIDLDGDGDLDIVSLGPVAGRTSNPLYIVLHLQIGVGSPPTLPGDFNRNGQVDAADYTIWRDNIGAALDNTYDAADANGDGVVDEGDYSIWRQNFGRSEGPPPLLAGDYNLDGFVDAADYTFWRDTLGDVLQVTYTGADGDGNGIVDEADYAVWRQNFGATLTPSPAGLALASVENSQADSAGPVDSAGRGVAASWWPTPQPDEPGHAWRSFRPTSPSGEVNSRIFAQYDGDDVAAIVLAADAEPRSSDAAVDAGFAAFEDAENSFEFSFERRRPSDRTGDDADWQVRDRAFRPFARQSR